MAAMRCAGVVRSPAKQETCASVVSCALHHDKHERCPGLACQDGAWLLGGRQQCADPDQRLRLSGAVLRGEPRCARVYLCRPWQRLLPGSGHAPSCREAATLEKRLVPQGQKEDEEEGGGENNEDEEDDDEIKDSDHHFGIFSRGS